MNAFGLHTERNTYWKESSWRRPWNCWRDQRRTVQKEKSTKSIKWKLYVNIYRQMSKRISFSEREQSEKFVAWSVYQPKKKAKTTWKPDLTKCIIYWLSMAKIWIFMVDRPSNALQIQSRIVSLLWKIDQSKPIEKETFLIDFIATIFVLCSKLKTATECCSCNSLPIHIFFEVYAATVSKIRLVRAFRHEFAISTKWKQAIQGTKRK